MRWLLAFLGGLGLGSVATYALQKPILPAWAETILSKMRIHVTTVDGREFDVIPLPDSPLVKLHFVGSGRDAVGRMLRVVLVGVNDNPERPFRPGVDVLITLWYRPESRKCVVWIGHFAIYRHDVYYAGKLLYTKEQGVEAYAHLFRLQL